MIIFVDIDNTITITNGSDYINSQPLYDKIKIINDLYDDGHAITYWTARGSASGTNHYELTKKQLNDWGVKYHDLMIGKPSYDIFIDDKTINKIEKNQIEWLIKEEEKN
jgi:hypothetical protein